MKESLDAKHAGSVSLVARNGKIVDGAAYGKRDLELPELAHMKVLTGELVCGDGEDQL